MRTFEQRAADVTSNRPRFPGDSPEVKCSGSWACSGGVHHCSCWWDSPDEGGRRCCQCGTKHTNGEEAQR